MEINKFINSGKNLERIVYFHIKRKHLIKIPTNKILIESHIEKAKHNLKFFNKNINDNEFNDWLIVALYYALYHSALALLANKGYTSKNHTATLLFIIKNYSISKDEADLINDLYIKREDAEFYVDLKEKRHNASYDTQILFTDNTIKYYQSKVIDFLNKVEDMLKD